MASRLPDGSIQMANGRIIYGNSVILAEDICELVPILCPPSASGASVFPGLFRGGGGGGGFGGFGGPGGGGGGAQGPRGIPGLPNQIQDEGLNLPQRSVLNFIGSGVSAVDNPGAGATDVTINDLYAATRIVSNDPAQGTDVTIQDAIDNLPAEGGTIFVKQGTYLITASILLPDKDVTIVGASGAVISLATAGAIFTLPILTGVRKIALQNLTLDGGSVVGVEALRSNQSAAFAFLVEYTQCRFINVETILNVAAEDTSYTTQGVFRYVDCMDLAPNLAGAVLGKTYGAPGSYNGSVAMEFWSWISLNANTRLVSWDGDWHGYASAFALKTASMTDGLYLSGCGLTLAGTLKSLGGTGLGTNLYDFISESSIGVTGSVEMSSHDSNFIYSVAYGTKVIMSGALARVVGSFFAPVGTGIGLLLTGSYNNIIGNHFNDIYATGAMTLLQLSSSFNPITGNFFIVGTPGTKTIVETAGQDVNSITSNVNTTGGAGMTLVGATTIAFTPGKNIS